MAHAEALEVGIPPPAGFSLDAYIQNHAFEMPTSGAAVVLEASFDAPAAQHLYETPLSSDQALTTRDDGRVHLKATVADTQQLRWWLKGFSAQVEVLAPEALRREFAEEAAQLLACYQKMEAA